VVWIANFLSQQGLGIKAGQIVITGSFAGVHEVEVGQELTITYGDLGSIVVRFQAS